MTGATGTCGAFVVKELLKQGYEVFAQSRHSVELDGAVNVPAELYGIATAHRFIDASDAIVHLASTRSKRRNVVVQSDILGTGTLLDLWGRGPFVYASSCMVYPVTTATLTETIPVDPTSSWYDMGKYVCEFQLGAACDRKERGPGIALRIPIVLSASRGRGQTLHMLYRDALRGATFVFDSEESLEDAGCAYIGVRDLARAVVLALFVPASGAYNVASGYVTWKALIDGINARCGTSARYVFRERGTLGPLEARLPQNRARVDTTKFTRAKAFTPSETIEQILEEFAAARGFAAAETLAGGEPVEELGA